jgi:transposase
MAMVMIGVDPHKGSHTAVAIGPGEEPLGRMGVTACLSQAAQLVAWAQAWPERTWAVEGAAGLGHLLAQQLVAAGEQVLDVPPRLAARVRLLQAGDTNKNDPDDALPVAVAALRSQAPRLVLAELVAWCLRCQAGFAFARRSSRVCGRALLIQRRDNSRWETTRRRPRTQRVHRGRAPSRGP